MFLFFHNDNTILLTFILFMFIFLLSFADGSFLRTLASSLIDFNELSSVAALNMLLEVGFKKKSVLSHLTSRRSSCQSFCTCSYMQSTSLNQLWFVSVCSRAWTTRRVFQQGALCCTAWKTLAPSWRLSPWTLQATCGLQSATSSRPSSQNCPLCSLWR